MTDRSTPELRELLAKATPGPLVARSRREPDLGFGAIPAMVVHVYRDEQGRRTTEFLATCDSTTAPNDANVELFALAPDLAAEVLRLREALEASRFEVFTASDGKPRLRLALERRDV